MIFNVDWDTFQRRYLSGQTIFCEEMDDCWIFYTKDSNMDVKCIRVKSSSPEENIMFIDKLTNGHGNLVKVLSVENEIAIDPHEDYVDDEDPDFIGLEEI